MTHRCTRGIWSISALEPLRQQKEGFFRCKKHSMSAAKRRGPSHTTWPGSRTRVSPRSLSTSRVRTRMVGHIYPCHYWIVPISVRSLTNLFGWSERLQSATHLTDSIPDGPCWTYLLNLDTDILEVYEPRCGLTAETEANEENNSLSTRDSPAYYCKMHLGELQAMWRKDWIMRHRMHAEELARLWSESTDRSRGEHARKPYLSEAFTIPHSISRRRERGGVIRGVIRGQTRVGPCRRVTHNLPAVDPECGKQEYRTLYLFTRGVWGKALLRKGRVRAATAGLPMSVSQRGLNAGLYIKAGSTNSAYSFK